MESKQQNYPSVVHKLSCSSFPSSHYLSLLASNSNSKSNLNSNSNATKPPSSVQVNASRRGLFFFNFFMSGVVYTTAGAPLERIKLLLQCQGEIVKSGRLLKPYKGIQDCNKSVVKNEGFFSLWRGSFTSLITRFPYQISNFAFVAYYDWLFKLKKDGNKNWNWTAGSIVSSAAAGATSSYFIYSLYYARTRLSNDIIMDKGSKRKFNGLFDVYCKTIQSEGTKGLYRGFNVHCFQIMVLQGLEIGLFAFLKPLVLPQEFQNNLLAMIALASCTANTALAVSYPFDTVHRRMMMTSCEGYKYKSAFEAASKMLKNEGFKSFYKGFVANYLHVIVTFVALSGYTRVQDSLFGQINDKTEVSIAFKMKNSADENPF